jgi:(p)ppGpp synthase/HD superfamily hydrolase
VTAPPPPSLCDLPVTCEAYAFASELHAGQQRASDAAPFILHPLEVAVLLRNRGFEDEVVAAGLLHDAVENTGATTGDVEERIGARVASLVAALSDDPGIGDYAERKAALREAVEAAGRDAQAIFAADKVAKARELRAELARNRALAGDPRIRARLRHYDACAEMLRRVAPDLALLAQLEFELWALRHLPPEPSARA